MNHDWTLNCYWQPFLKFKHKPEIPVFICNNCKIQAVGPEFNIWPIYKNMTCDEIIIKEIIK